MIQKYLDALKNANTGVEMSAAIVDIARYLKDLQGLKTSLENLHATATDSLVNHQLDEAEKGHRLGTIEICEIMIKVF